MSEFYQSNRAHYNAGNYNEVTNNTANVACFSMCFIPAFLAGAILSNVATLRIDDSIASIHKDITATSN